MPAVPPDRIPIYTIGYGSRSIEDTIAVLHEYEIEYLIDIRSAPYSRYKPEFSREPLEAALLAAGIRYVFMGDALGGRPDDLDCYDADGKVNYEKVMAKDFYRAGIGRIVTAFEKQQRVVLMCSEGKPQDCHRSKLIGESLDHAGIPIVHIDEGGQTKSQSHVMAIVNPQPSLFEGFETHTSRKRYAPTEKLQDDLDNM